MIDLTGLSRRYAVRRLTEEDTSRILVLCQKNTLFYKYAQAEPTEEQIHQDLRITPPGIDSSDKYFLGFFQNDTLIAVMDLIDGYPSPETAFIGFFMMNADFQGQGIGTSIITEAGEYLKTLGKTRLQLGIDKENPQSTRFWTKNGFQVIREIQRDGHGILYAEKELSV